MVKEISKSLVEGKIDFWGAQNTEEKKRKTVKRQKAGLSPCLHLTDKASKSGPGSLRRIQPS